MSDQPPDKKYIDENCRGCEYLKMLYELENREYYFGCDHPLTCKFTESDEDK